jgi:hypothetical protein
MRWRRSVGTRQPAAGHRTGGLPRVRAGRRCDWDHSIGWVPVQHETASEKGNTFESGDHPMREDHSERNQLSDIELEVSDLELEDVVGGSAKTFQANTNRYDPYKSFRF